MIDCSHLIDLNKNDYKPLYIQLSEVLAEYIQTKGLYEGDALPSENELLAQYDISRTTIRQAMQRLESQDIVRKVRGKGTFVAASKSRESIRGFQNLEETLARKGIELSNILLEFKDTSPLNTWAKDLHLVEWKKIKLIRRLKLADKKPLAIEERLLPFELAQGILKTDFHTKPIFDLLEANPDNEIFRVTYTITNIPLTEEEADTLEVGLHASAIRRTGVYFNRQEIPVMFGRVTFLADRIKLKFEFHKADDTWEIVSVV